jgi:hypothetical protein
MNCINVYYSRQLPFTQEWISARSVIQIYDTENSGDLNPWTGNAILPFPRYWLPGRQNYYNMRATTLLLQLFLSAHVATDDRVNVFLMRTDVITISAIVRIIYYITTL